MFMQVWYVCMLLCSLLYGMRLTVHLELAKISAQSHLLQAALDHLDKVLKKMHLIQTFYSLYVILGNGTGH